MEDTSINININNDNVREDSNKKLLVTRIAKTIYEALKSKSDLRNLVQNIEDDGDEDGRGGGGGRKHPSSVGNDKGSLKIGRERERGCIMETYLFSFFTFYWLVVLYGLGVKGGKFLN